MLYGAIIGDIVGSIYEVNNVKSRDFEFFGKGCHFTDDTVMTLAIADALLTNQNERDEAVLSARFVESMQKLGRQYPDVGYGRQFEQWLKSKDPKPYGSWANGAAMRVSPCAYVAKDDADLAVLVSIQSIVTHDHADAVRGALIAAYCTYIARFGGNKIISVACTLRDNYEYGTMLLEGWHHVLHKRFDARCAYTIPPAVQSVIEAHDFESAIRNAVYVGGDSDTIASIAGAIAEPLFGIPENMKEKARTYLTDDLLEILDRFENLIHVSQ